MRKIISSQSVQNLSFALLFVIVGVLLSLSFDSIRYTKYVEPQMVEMDPRVVYETIQANPEKALFLDVRTPGEYTALHASTSISFPIQKLYDAWRTMPRTDKKIYVICTSGRLAAVAYGYLQLHGFRNIVHVTGGIQNWVDEGLPTQGKPIFVDKNFSLDKPVDLPNTVSPQ